MLLIGLTGSIASGKSTVARFFRALGATVIDADVLAREVVEPNTKGLAQVAAAFGRQILTETGALDRKKLGDIVFRDAEKRKELEHIVHPLIFQRFQELSKEAKTRGERAVIYDAPLLFERGLNHLMNATIVVNVPPAVQLERLMKREVITDAEAKARITTQMPLAEKVRLADYVIDNGHSLEHTRSQVEYIWRAIMKRSLAEVAPDADDE